MTEKVKTNVPVFLFLIDDKNRVYLQRRYQTGFLDGYYEPPAGGLHDKEFPQAAACREAKEEAGVIVDPRDVELFHAFLNFNTETNPFLGLFFRTRKWQGAPVITEPDLCDDANFYTLDQLPEKVIPQVRDALDHLLSGPAIVLSNYESLTARLEEQRPGIA
jgi:8-oxo-dGTP pyrophosphatase MutT (NUDIX family)